MCLHCAIQHIKDFPRPKCESSKHYLSCYDLEVVTEDGTEKVRVSHHVVHTKIPQCSPSCLFPPFGVSKQEIDFACPTCIFRYEGHNFLYEWQSWLAARRSQEEMETEFSMGPWSSITKQDLEENSDRVEQQRLDIKNRTSTKMWKHFIDVGYDGMLEEFDELRSSRLHGEFVILSQWREDVGKEATTRYEGEMQVVHFYGQLTNQFLAYMPERLPGPTTSLARLSRLPDELEWQAEERWRAMIAQHIFGRMDELNISSWQYRLGHRLTRGDTSDSRLQQCVISTLPLQELEYIYDWICQENSSSSGDSGSQQSDVSGDQVIPDEILGGDSLYGDNDSQVDWDVSEHSLTEDDGDNDSEDRMDIDEDEDDLVDRIDIDEADSDSHNQ